MRDKRSQTEGRGHTWNKICRKRIGGREGIGTETHKKH
jgi:hypothetical protein